MCSAEDAGRHVNDRGGGGMRGFQRSQSQNDLDRQTRDDDGRLFDAKDLRSAASGYDIHLHQQREASNQALRRHPSDVADRYRRSYGGDWNMEQGPPTTADMSWTDALVLRQQQVDQKPRSPSDPMRNSETTPQDGHGGEYPRRDYSGNERRDRGGEYHRNDRRFRSSGDEFLRSHENMTAATDVVSALNKKTSVGAENPKNQDIMNWLQLGNGIDPEPRMVDSNPNIREHVSRDGLNYMPFTLEDQPSSRTAAFGAGQGMGLSSPRSYPATRNSSDVTGGRMDLRVSSPRVDKSASSFPQIGVANPTYDAGQRASVSDIFIF